MTTKPPPRLEEVLAAFDDDALVKMLLARFADGFPDFASGGERMRAAANRAREIIRNAFENAVAGQKVEELLYGVRMAYRNLSSLPPGQEDETRRRELDRLRGLIERLGGNYFFS